MTDQHQAGGSGAGSTVPEQWYTEATETIRQLRVDLDSSQEAGRTIAAYVYSIMNPGQIPEHVKTAMREFQ